jgi:guanylate kinase
LKKRSNSRIENVKASAHRKPSKRKRKESGKGNLFIVSAPSGAGKTTLCNKVAKAIDNLRQSVSYTTREPRKGEANDMDYSFISEEEFRKMVLRGDFIEWATVHGNLYGTSRKRLKHLVDSGFDLILDIDIQGADQIRRSFKDGVFVFILPPSMKVLKERLKKRKSDTKEDIKSRIKSAVKEIGEYNKYDYVIVNDKLRDSLKKLESIIIAERLRNREKGRKMVIDILNNKN